MTLPVSKNDYCVVFVGPIAVEGEIPIGGYEAANRRTILNLELNGIDVIKLPYPIVRSFFLWKSFDYALGFAKLLKILNKLLRNKNKKTICHITGLYKHFIYVELLFVILAKILCGRVIYEIRAGSMFWHYNRKTIIYKLTFSKVLQLSSIVGAQGREYFNFIESKTGKTPFYMPNYVDTIASTHLSELRKKELDKTMTIHLVYFGRITLSKGTQTIIDIYMSMKKSGKSVTLCMIGLISPDCALIMNELKYNDKSVVIINGLPQEQIFDILTTKHFFIFPTSHTGEGHSNALTEAMANGCVPICSDVGFNKSVVGDCGIILPSHSCTSEYVTAITNIVTDDKWIILSKKALNRIRNNFHAKKVIGNLINLYDTITQD
jgi:glycosyltransferase involved in cell wall biosynthesis